MLSNRTNMTLPRDLYAKVAAVLGNCDGVRVAFLFGSTVVGGTWTQSDLDIAVGWEIGFDDERRLDAQLELIDALTGALGQLGEQADLVDIDRASSAVAFRAISEGVCVFASSESERVDAIVNTCRRYDDDAPGRVRFQRAALAAVERMKVGVHG